MDRLEAMSIFVEAVDAGSLSAAGRKLGIPLATVSRKVSELETHLNTRLLIRGNRQLQLTDAGASYLEDCRRIISEVRQAERRASGEYRAPTGDLVITSPMVFGRLYLLPVISAFLKAYPNVNIRLIQTERRVNLVEEQVDLAVRFGQLPDSSLIAKNLGSIRIVTCASPAYLLKHGIPATPDELAFHDCIAFDAITVGDRWAFSQGKSGIDAAIRQRLMVNSAETAVDAALQGLGVARVLSYQVADAIENGSLRLLLNDYEQEAIPVNLVFPRQRMLPLKLRAFLDFAAPILREKLSANLSPGTV